MNTISMSVIVCCLIACIITTLVPILVSVVLIVHKKLNVMPLFIGFLAFFISQIVLRVPIMNVLSNVSKDYNEFVSTLIGSILIGGLTAGLFEETARLIGARILLKKDKLSFKDGVSFGLGHSFCEVIILVGLSMISTFVTFIMINTNTFYDFMMASGIKETQYAEYLDMYTSINAIDFIYSIVERCSTIMFHTMNTIIIFFAVKNKKYGYYILTILLHTIFNGGAIILSKYCGNLITEIVLLVTSSIGLIFVIKKLKSQLA